MLTQKGHARKREDLVNLLTRLKVAEAAGIDRDNPFLAIHGLHKAFETVKKDKGLHIKELHIKETIMLALAYRYEEAGYTEDALYWYRQCLNEGLYGNNPQYRIHLMGNIFLNSVNLSNSSETDKDYNGFIAFMGKRSENICDSELSEQVLALKCFAEAKKHDVFESRNYEKIEVLLNNSKEICQRYERYLLFQKLNLAAAEMLADLSYRQNNSAKALHLFHKTAVLAIKYGNTAKLACFHKICSDIYEKEGHISKALQQYKKYYSLSEKAHKKRSEEFSDYLFEINDLKVTENSITTLKGIKEYLKIKRNIDYLTGVFNRRFWDEALEQKSENLSPDSLITMLIMDIDNFKDYNDLYGHMEGDKVLEAVGRTLKRSIRMETDILARYGGDEFVILLDGMGVSESKDLAERIRQNIRNLSYGSKKGNVTVSIGLSTGYIKNRDSIGNLLKEADKSLYYSKKNGRDRFTHFVDIGED